MHLSTRCQLVLSILLANNTDRRIRLVEFLQAFVEFGQISDILTSEVDFQELLGSELHLRELRTLDKKRNTEGSEERVAVLKTRLSKFPIAKMLPAATEDTPSKFWPIRMYMFSNTTSYTYFYYYNLQFLIDYFNSKS
jgi:hypothetical protein